MQSYATKVPVGSGAPGPSRDSRTPHLQVSVRHKVSSARMTTSHVNPGRDSHEGPPTIPRPVAQLKKPTSDTKAPQKAQNLPLTREGTSTDRTHNIAATSGSGSQRGVPRSFRTSTTPKMSQTLIQLGPHEISSSTRHDHEGFALPPSLPQYVQGLLRSVVIDPELRVWVGNNPCRHSEEADVAVFRNMRQQQQGKNLRLWGSTPSERWDVSAEAPQISSPAGASHLSFSMINLSIRQKLRVNPASASNFVFIVLAASLTNAPARIRDSAYVKRR
ncbi:hypothetical protein B0H14DRAFT_3137934 [Mycena olivaceomarginata]|nr:hypothetical protein B0H14DRAFT_3137934 [Mycena olivaceomarginata]